MVKTTEQFNADLLAHAITWRDRKRRGENTNSKHFTRYALGADAYVGGKKVGGVSHSGSTWWYTMVPSGSRSTSFYPTKEKAKFAFEESLQKPNGEVG